MRLSALLCASALLYAAGVEGVAGPSAAELQMWFGRLSGAEGDINLISKYITDAENAHVAPPIMDKIRVEAQRIIMGGYERKKAEKKDVIRDQFRKNIREATDTKMLEN